MRNRPLLPPLTRRQCLGVLGVTTVAACGRRGVLEEVDAAPTDAADSIRLLVASSREPAPPPEFFSAERSGTTSFADFTVSVPKDRKLGRIKYPSGRPAPEEHFLVAKAERLEGPGAFVSTIDATASDSATTTGQLFVHGFNTNFAEALMKAAQLDHDLQTPGIHMMFTWPSVAHLAAYASDRETALFSRDALAETLRLIARTILRDYHLVAHSMGTFLAMDTLRTMALAGEQSVLRKIGAIILISADLDIDVFRSQAEPILTLGVPIYLLISRNDRALGLSSQIRGNQRRVGNIKSASDLGTLNVSIIDVSDVKAGDVTGHFKVGSSPELIKFIQRIRRSGVSIFDDGQKIGLFDMGAILVQDGNGILMKPMP